MRERFFLPLLNMNNLNTIFLITVSLLLTSCHTEYIQPSPDKSIHYVPQSSNKMNTTSSVFLSNKVLTPDLKMPQQNDIETVTYSPDLYEQVLEYYRHKNEYFPD